MSRPDRQKNWSSKGGGNVWRTQLQLQQQQQQPVAWPCGPTNWWPGHPMTSTLPSCHGTSRPLRASALWAIIGSISPVWLMCSKSCPRPGLSPDSALQVSISVSLQHLGQPCPEHGGTSWERTRRDETGVNFCRCHYEKLQVSHVLWKEKW